MGTARDAWASIEPLEQRQLLATGDIDLTFGEDGYAQVDLPAAHDQAIAGAVQPDGKIVILGVNDGGVTLTRLTPDGELDATFGTGGTATHEFDRAQFTEVMIGNGGKILVAGTLKYKYAIVRFTDAGAIDATYGTNGVVNTGLKMVGAVHAGMVMQPGAKVVLGATLDGKTTFARYGPGGAIDRTFGNRGRTVVPGLLVEDLALDASRRIVLAGTASNMFCAGRLDARGRLDGSFGKSGLAYVAFGKKKIGGAATAVAVQPNGRVVAAGSYKNKLLVVARFKTNGAADTTFGRAGRQTADLYGEALWATDVAMQDDGRIVVAGVYQEEVTDDELTGDAVLARYTPSAGADGTFGEHGVIRYDLDEPDSDDRAVGVAVQAERLVLVGWTGAGAIAAAGVLSSEVPD